MSLTPQSQGRLLGPRREVVPLIERVPPRQQTPEPGVGASSAETLPDLVEIPGQELAGEVERERLAEVEIPLVGYRRKFLGIVDVIRQRAKVVGELGRYHRRRQPASRLAHGKTIGSISDGSLFLTLPTRELTGQQTMFSAG